MRSPDRTALIIFAAMTCTLVLLSSAHTSLAATDYVLDPTDPSVGAACASLGGSWDGPGTCTLGGDLTLGAFDSMLVDPGAALVIPSGDSLTNVGSIDDYGTITIGAGGSLLNNGTITAFIANGTMTNDGGIQNDLIGTIIIEHPAQSPVEKGDFNFTNSGTIDNRGMFVSFGNFTNSAKASITNSGTFDFASTTPDTGKFSAPVTVNAGDFTNSAQGMVTEQGATLNNTGAFVNAGTISEEQNVFSVINNAGTFSSNGTMTNEALFDNVGGTVTNSGTIDNVVGCSIATCGSITNSGIIVNEAGGTISNQGNIGNDNLNPRRPQLGNLTNYGTLTNSGLFVNSVGGTITNRGVIDSSGTISNLGSISNLESIASSGNLINSGYIDNGANASITNTRTVENGGSITNLGTITNACGGIIDGSGTITGNPVVTTTTCAVVTSPVPEFPDSLVALTLLATLVLASLGARRAGRPRRGRDRAP